MPKILYQCNDCGKTFENQADAMKCEKGILGSVLDYKGVEAAVQPLHMMANFFTALADDLAAASSYQTSCIRSLIRHAIDRGEKLNELPHETIARVCGIDEDSAIKLCTDHGVDPHVPF